MASAITPLVTGPDEVARSTFVFSTTIGSRFFSGTMDASTVDMEVSVRGGAFTSDPDLVVFEGTTWLVPNPAVYPDGLELVSGLNRIQIRAITTTGAVSTPATIDLTLVQEGDVGVVVQSPTNISIKQYNDQVEIAVEGIDDDNVRGYNFYASTEPGGGTSGYLRVNLYTISDGTTIEELSVLGDVTVDANVAMSGGEPAADPLYVRLRGDQVDSFDAILQDDFTQDIAVSETVTKVRTTITVESVRQITSYSFKHSRTAGQNSAPPTISIGAFAATPDTDPLYYVVTAIYYDSTTLVEVESPFSAEVVGHPIRVVANIGTFPIAGRQQIARDVITSIFRSNPQVRVDPGSVLRDTVIDPFSSEAERIRFLVDFLHRAQTFQGLLQIDDPQNTGTSDNPVTSSYKQALKKALFLSSDSAVQAVVDRAFDNIASRYGVFRRSGKFARSEVMFYTANRPTKSYSIALGTTVAAGAVNFSTTKAVEISLSHLASYFNPTSKRYFVRAPVRAAAVGTSGNVGAGQIRKIGTTGLSGLQVTNEAAAFGGLDLETNRGLAERAQNALASVDSGTVRGYLQTAADVPGVVKANVVAVGNDLMQRDLDVSGTHRGGKVDIWIQGESLAQVTDTFAFTFEIAKDIQFELIGDPADLEFRSVDSNLSSDNPILELLDNSSAGYAFRNATTGLSFDITDAEITAYNTVRLSTDVVQPTVTLTDVILGDYRRREGSRFILTRQPVHEIVSVTGTVSGELESDAYALYHPESPLEDGRSQLAGDYLLISGTTESNGDLLPSGDSIQVTDESHVVIGSYIEYLDNLGANFLTIVVKSEDGLTTYRGPNDPSGVSDYTIIDGGQTTAAGIKRVDGGDIASGETVLVSYEHDENFTVVYTTNLVVSVAQDAVDAKRHVTADVLVKEAFAVPIDISATVVLKKGAEQSTVDQAIRTNLENYFAALRLGDPVRQSDVIAVIENTMDVSYVVVPVTKLVRAEGAAVIRESLSTDRAGDVTYISSWSSSTVSVWIIEQELDAATTDGGGPVMDFRSVVQDTMGLILQTSQPSTLGLEAGLAYIIGSGGYAIPGYSDDDTLSAQGYESSAVKAAQRVVLTANRVLVSTVVSDAPANHDYWVTYIVGADSGPKDIDPGTAEYLTVGALEFTYDEDR